MSKRQRGGGTLFRVGGKGPWVASWFTTNGKRRKKSTGTTDKATASRILQKLVADEALRKAGILDPTAERHAAEARRPIGEHVADWRRAMASKGTTADYSKQTADRVTRLLRDANVRTLGDLQPSRIMAALGRLQVMPKRRGTDADADHALVPASVQTTGHYCRAIKQFSRWLARDGRQAVDVLAHISVKSVVDGDETFERRELTADEMARVVEVAHVRPLAERGRRTVLLPPVPGKRTAWIFEPLTDANLSACEQRARERLAGKPGRLAKLEAVGLDHAMSYRVAFATGFRAGELRSLTPASFDLDADPPTVTVQAAYSKRRRTDVQPIPEALARILSPWLGSKAASRPVFNLPEKTAQMLRADLAAAGVAYVDDDGRVADFHATRHTYVSRVVASGASTKTAMELSRHSDPKLTLKRYAHARLADLKSTVEALPVAGAEPVEEALRATGTDGSTSGSITSAKQGKTRSQSATSNAPAGGGGGCKNSPKSLEKTQENEASRSITANAPGWTRTSDPRFRKPVLYPAELRAPEDGVQPIIIATCAGVSSVEKWGRGSLGVLLGPAAQG